MIGLKSAALSLAAIALSGCAGMTAGAGNTDLIGTLKEIASDPRCAHVDRVSGNLGGLGGNNLNIYLERTCPAGSPPTP